MRNPVRLSLATYFVVLSILYLTIRYTTFEMRPAIFLIASLLLIISAASVMKFRKDSDMMETSILFLTVIMVLSFLIK